MYDEAIQAKLAPHFKALGFRSPWFCSTMSNPMPGATHREFASSKALEIRTAQCILTYLSISEPQRKAA